MATFGDRDDSRRAWQVRGERRLLRRMARHRRTAITEPALDDDATLAAIAAVKATVMTDS